MTWPSFKTLLYFMNILVYFGELLSKFGELLSKFGEHLKKRPKIKCQGSDLVLMRLDYSVNLIISHMDLVTFSKLSFLPCFSNQLSLLL